MGKVIHFRSIKSSILMAIVWGSIYLVALSVMTYLFKNNVITGDIFGIFVIVFAVAFIFYTVFWTFYFNYKIDKGEIEFNERDKNE